MKLRMPRWQRSKKAKTTTSTPPNPGTDSARKSQISHQDHVRQAIENVRSSQAPPGEVYGLTILEDNEYLVGWMNVTNSRFSSASSMRRNAVIEGFVDCRIASVAILERHGPVAGDERDFRSATSASTMETNTSGGQRFGKSGIEIPGGGRIDTQGPRVQIHFKVIDWNPPPTRRLENANGIGPAGEIADYEV